MSSINKGQPQLIIHYYLKIKIHIYYKKINLPIAIDLKLSVIKLNERVSAIKIFLLRAEIGHPENN